MTDSKDNLLLKIFDVLNRGEKVYVLSKSNHSEMATAEFLEDSCLIKRGSSSQQWIHYTITRPGYDYIDKLKSSKNPPVTIYGDYNVVAGEGATVTNFFDSVAFNIGNSDLPPESKELLMSLVTELKAEKNPETKASMIRKFLTDVAGDAISTGAASILITLIGSCF